MTQNDNEFQRRPNTEESRAFARRHVLWSGILAGSDRKFLCDCEIWDYSVAGAKIRAARPIPVIPHGEQLHLVDLRNHIAYGATVAWRNGLHLGLQFVDYNVVYPGMPSDLLFLQSLFIKAKARQVDELINSGLSRAQAMETVGVTEDLLKP